LAESENETKIECGERERERSFESPFHPKGEAGG
jgi:hypothetical protein